MVHEINNQYISLLLIGGFLLCFLTGTAFIVDSVGRFLFDWWDKPASSTAILVYLLINLSLMYYLLNKLSKTNKIKDV